MPKESAATRPQDHTSLSLLDQARQDPNGTAWTRFVVIYGGLIQKWLLTRGLPVQEVDDIRQEVMAVVIRELPRFEHNGNPGAFRNWMRTITANRLKQFWQKNARNRQLHGGDSSDLAEQLTDPHSSVSALWNQEHDSYVLHRLLEIVAERVQPKTLEAFRRVVLLQQPVKDVARDLDMKAGAVRVAQCRVLRALREEGCGLID